MHTGRLSIVLCSCGKRVAGKRIVANSPERERIPPGLPAGRAESFPVKGELAFAPLSPNRPPRTESPQLVTRLWRCLPDFAFLQIEILIPVAASPPGAVRLRLSCLHMAQRSR